MKRNIALINQEAVSTVILSLALFPLLAPPILTIMTIADDQECKLEEGVIDESSRRIYHRRRLNLDESKDDSKENDSVEETKYRDSPRNNASAPPLLRSSRPVRHSYRIRPTPEEKLRERFSHRLRGAVDDVPEVHFIGEICEGIGFKGTFVSCKW